ncbi:sigma-70 family RNA polymerase sigma factor [Neobacillus notoginsengisoli]|uniref:Sigma-70 family RNA polymerase sigma factor n=1 Tax=Neobacillus notoginsengisoli TaxID=1578198 RepID=A0A417YQU0_9BACI|nr:sigma-70 family RNA polymerase sigma factor [Neobacillus notoginsengisoli]RHW37231.1 sigma-70 family RNA polymerase sigma factor [Neobacillus notoginsengisoli]
MENFEPIADQYTPMIYSIIRSLHIYKNKEDFYQTGLIALWEATRNFQPEKGSFEGYAYRYIKGRMMTELTKMNLNAERTVSPSEEFWEMIEETQMDEALPVELLLSYCGGLTPNQKKWVLYTCIDYLSIKEIAEKENVSMSAVKNWRHGARKKLLEGLEIVD